jgi:predicted nuclease of predicted toxin-antitoxin system
VRLWIDENLTPRLAAAAHARGYQATTSRDRGRLRLPDAKLYHEVRDGDWILVTNDRQDFERLLAQADLHPGLIVLPLRKRDEQTAILEKVIDYIVVCV